MRIKKLDFTLTELDLLDGLVSILTFEVVVNILVLTTNHHNLGLPGSDSQMG